MKKQLFLAVCGSILLCNSSSAQWSLTGNAISSSNFLGTTNTNPLVFKVNSTQAGKLEGISGSFYNNSFFGYNSGIGATSTNGNTGLGAWTLQAGCTGGENTGVGSGALYANTTGYWNTALGFSALSSNIGGIGNTAVGMNALYSNTGTTGGILGNYSTAVGYQAAQSNTTGYQNIAIGWQALYSNQVSNYNIAIGNQAFYSLTGFSGGGVAIGVNSQGGCTTGGANTAVGNSSMGSNTTGGWNTAVGDAAMGGIGVGSLSTGSYNTATGAEAMRELSSGTYNTATGYNASTNNTTGGYNTAEGANALQVNQDGSYNVAVGYQALDSNTNTGNTAVGVGSLWRNSTGYINTGTGAFSLGTNSTGYYNSAFGYLALNTNTTGAFNTAVGTRADVNNGAYSNCSVIGYNAMGTASNSVVIGNTSVTSIGGYTNWANLSDSRFKKNINQDVHGLDFILKLRPVTYNLDATKLNAFLGVKDSVEGSVAKKESIKYTGFLAQEVEKAAVDVNYDFSGVIKPQNDKDHYKLVYGDFVVPLVKAVQDQQKMIDSLMLQVGRLAALIAQNNSTTPTNVITLGGNDAIILNQNVPNPFAEQTSISYSIPQEVVSAQVLFYDANGKLIKTGEIKTRGQGQLSVYGDDLSSGIYTYTLMADGKIVDTRKMVKQ